MARNAPKSAPTRRLTQTHAVEQEQPTVSARWLLVALAIVVPVAGLCAWGTLCLLFWQGSWQLLYHPSANVTRTPSNIGLGYSMVGFATTDTGVSRLAGWWIPAEPAARMTALYLHDGNGNMGDTLDDLARLHTAGLNVLAFDYRGYGTSQFAHPSEKTLRQDADWALEYLAGTRHVDPHTTILAGRGLGANLALEVAATHPDLAGVVLESPMEAPADAIFSDSRAWLVPAHLLVSDRYDLNAAAAALRVPSLWLVQRNSPKIDAAFQRVSARKTRVDIEASAASDEVFKDTFSRGLGSLVR
jgi:pimeloyl-ACP methyl ester carboxylesterase